MTPEARRILAEAKGLVAHGWFQMGGPESSQHVGAFPAHCVSTALVEATNRRGARGFREAIDALASIVGHNLFPAWNDAPERTHAEVVALFDKALMAPLSEWDREAVSRTPLGRAHGGMSPRVASHSLSGGSKDRRQSTSLPTPPQGAVPAQVFEGAV